MSLRSPCLACPPGVPWRFVAPPSSGVNKENEALKLPEKPKKGKKRALLPSFLPLVGSSLHGPCEVPRAARGVRGPWPSGGLHDRGRAAGQRQVTIACKPSITQPNVPRYTLQTTEYRSGRSSNLQLLDLSIETRAFIDFRRLPHSRRERGRDGEAGGIIDETICLLFNLRLYDY